MAITADQIYQSILHRAADEWGVEYEDVERDIGQQFDPIVRFMAGACASELERVYQQIHETEGRLQQRLARVLLPEYFHLPEPAHALATATAASDPVAIDETTAFFHDLGEKKGDLAFSPLFPMRLVPGEIQVVATPERVLDMEQRAPLSKGKEKNTENRVGKILLGIELKTPISDWRGMALYFDLRGRSTDESEKARFFSALSRSKCFLNNRELKLVSGLPATELIIEDYLNGNERLQTRIRARYERHFLTFDEENFQTDAGAPPQVFLPHWFQQNQLAQAAIDKEVGRMGKDQKKNLVWLEIHFGRPVEIAQLTSRLTVRFNVFPVVNRRLCGSGSGEHHFLQSNSIKWLHLQPAESFVAMRRVFEEKPPEYPVFTFKPFAEFREESKPGYTLRMGGIGRWDDFNVWQRLAYVIAILQENYGHQELIQKAAATLSLEDVHSLLGKKIAESAGEQKPVSDIYILLHTGIKSGMRVKTEYWTSVGTAGNGIAAKTALKCTSKECGELEKDSVELISVSEEGADPRNPTEQLDAMKASLLSRGRIVTREDVKTFCRVHLKERLAEVTIRDGVGTDPRNDFGMTRRLDVILMPSPKSIQEDWEAICNQMQGLLEQKSSSNVPINVCLASNKMAISA